MSILTRLATAAVQRQNERLIRELAETRDSSDTRDEVIRLGGQLQRRAAEIRLEWAKQRGDQLERDLGAARDRIRQLEKDLAAERITVEDLRAQQRAKARTS